MCVDEYVFDCACVCVCVWWGNQGSHAGGGELKVQQSACLSHLHVCTS